jgi:hypothetical protein
VLQILPDGSCVSVLVDPKIKGKARKALTDAARAGEARLLPAAAGGERGSQSCFPRAVGTLFRPVRRTRGRGLPV